MNFVNVSSHASKKSAETLMAVAADHSIEVSSEVEDQGLLRVHLLLIM